MAGCIAVQCSFLNLIDCILRGMNTIPKSRNDLKLRAVLLHSGAHFIDWKEFRTSLDWPGVKSSSDPDVQYSSPAMTLFRANLGLWSCHMIAPAKHYACDCLNGIRIWACNSMIGYRYWIVFLGAASKLLAIDAAEGAAWHYKLSARWRVALQFNADFVIWLTESFGVWTSSIEQ